MSKKPVSNKPVSKAKASAGDSFVPDDAVSTGNNSYLKFEEAKTKFRVISKPIVGWVNWEEDEDGKKKPVRTAINDEPEVTDPENKPKKFMAMVVIDRADDVVKILDVTQQGVIKGIQALSANPDWGNPFTYDLNVDKKGEGKKTRYSVTPSPRKALDKSVIKEAMNKPCNLDALFEGE